MSKITYYNVDDTIKEFPEATSFFLFGQGGVGKSYSVKRWMLRNWLKYKETFIYVKRYDTDIQGNALESVFSDVENDKEIIDLIENNSRYDAYYKVHVLQQGAWFVLKGEYEDGRLEVIDKIGRIVALSKARKFKGEVHNTATSIFLDEFITDTGYVRGDKEVELMNIIIGTVARIGNEKPVRVFYAGNPDASIEMCPYLYPLSLNYEKMDPNTAYAFDSVEPNGHRIANNIICVKLAKYGGQVFIANKAAYIYGTAEELARAEGQVKKGKFIDIPYEDDFTPIFELIVETPVIASYEYHKRIYVYYGECWGEPVCVVCAHEDYKLEAAIYCRYDKQDFRRRPQRQTYRLNIPPEEGFKELLHMMRIIDYNKLVISHDAALPTLLEQIKLNS